MERDTFMEHFITEIWIEELRHLSNFKIELNKGKRTHLLLTGKNGSGKTTLLRAVKQYLQAIENDRLTDIEVTYPREMQNFEELIRNAQDENEKSHLQKNYQGYVSEMKRYCAGIGMAFSYSNGLGKLYQEGKFLIAFYGADRKTGISRVKGVEDVVLANSYPPDFNLGDVLLKYLVHLKTQQSYARNEGDMQVVKMLDTWFERFENALKALLDNENIQLQYDYKNYNFQIMEEGRRAFGFDGLSDGYSAAIQILSDLILRMEQNWMKKGALSSYDVEGIVMIDELETHLHIGLQRKILPFLAAFFPRIQFIVSTHSPYIINSIEGCVIYDLENHIRMENMFGYSAEGIVEGYFGFDTYSDILMEKVKRYETLVDEADLTEEERAERARLFVELKQLSGDLAKEARSAFEEIEQRRKQNDKI